MTGLRGPRVRRWPSAAIVALAALVAVAAVRVVPRVVRDATRPTPCFVAHYTLARMLHDGVGLSRSYDDAWFVAATASVTPGVSDINVNPPTTALLLLPVAGLGYAGARVTWTLVSTALLAATVALLIRETNLTGAWALGFVALVLLYQPAAADFAFANVYVLLLAASAVAWRAWRRREEALLGVALAAMLAIKLAGGLLVVLLLAERRWKALAWCGAALVAVGAASLPWVGLGAWRADAAALVAAAGRPERAVTAYQSVTGFVHHVLARGPFNPAPIADAPGAAAALAWIAIPVIVSAGVAVALRHPLDDRVFAAFAAAGVVASPLALDYTYTLLLLPAAIALAWVRERRSPAATALVIAALLPIAADLPYRSPRVAAGAMALFAYPKLAGALLLWAVLLASTWRAARAHEMTAASTAVPAPGLEG